MSAARRDDVLDNAGTRRWLGGVEGAEKACTTKQKRLHADVGADKPIEFVR